MLTLCVRFVAEPANQELALTSTPEPIHNNNNTDIFEIDESTISLVIMTWHASREVQADSYVTILNDGILRALQCALERQFENYQVWIVVGENVPTTG